MKRILALSAALVLAGPQVFAYNMKQIESIEAMTARAKAATVVASLFTENEEIATLGNLSGMCNRVMAYTISKQSGFMVGSRVVEAVAKVINEGRKQAEKDNTSLKYDAALLTAAGIELGEAVLKEAANYAKVRGLSFALPKLTSNDLIKRAVYAVSTAAVAAVVETMFANIKHKVYETEVVPANMTVFWDSLARNAAFEAFNHVIALAIASGSEDAAPVFDVENLRSAIGMKSTQMVKVS